MMREEKGKVKRRHSIDSLKKVNSIAATAAVKDAMTLEAACPSCYVYYEAITYFSYDLLLLTLRRFCGP